ncbi:hypothetical protein [Kytococcus sedentarius]|uniref:hypothetical protein n=1 Tax=Kytococcus sedentarius TaxID=1276 RepID=UPI00384A6B3C
MTHPADALADRAASLLAAAGHNLDHADVTRACRRWWAYSRPNRVPFGYALGHYLPLNHDTHAALDAAGAEAASNAAEADLVGGGVA